MHINMCDCLPIEKVVQSLDSYRAVVTHFSKDSWNGIHLSDIVAILDGFMQIAGSADQSSQPSY